MTFVPTIEGASDDPAVQFVANGARLLPLTVEEGETAARLGGEPAAWFQTGTTAGTIVFDVELGARRSEASITMPPAPVVIDVGSTSRTSTGLEVQVSGFDNTLSASNVAFTFYDTTGGRITPQPLRADVAGAFRDHFGSAQLGGLFALKASFPVAGDASQIGAVEVEFVNNAGTSAAHRLTF